MIPTVTPINIRVAQTQLAEIRLQNNVHLHQWAGCKIPVAGVVWQVIGMHGGKVLARNESNQLGLIPVHEVAHSLNNYRT